MREQVRERLHVAVDAYCAEPADPQLVALSLAQLVGEARADGVRAEHLVVALHNIWDARFPCGPIASDSNVALDRLIDQCLSAYYATSGSGARDNEARSAAGGDRSDLQS